MDSLLDFYLSRGLETDMTKSPLSNRSNGLLAHITSLPSRYGIGDIGPSSYSFVDFLVKSGQSYWQLLPTSPTSPLFDNSPYMSSSAFAGSFLLISPDLLFQQGLLEKKEIESYPQFSQYITQFDKVMEAKLQLLEKAFARFDGFHSKQYRRFLDNSPWLNDYALFMTLKELYPLTAWLGWPEDIAKRESETIAQIHKKHKQRIDYFRFEQFEFFRQWNLLREYTRKSAISLFGDIPIYVGLDSSDVWANQDIFKLDRHTLLPTEVAGVPPDYFSDTGQRWGNPLYRWDSSSTTVSNQLITWWVQRFKSVFEMVDVARIDHFRGFESYWSIPAEEKTAVKGTWLKGPGKAFFTSVFEKLGPLNIIAEDLGIITPAVEKLRDDLAFPGMKILQFAFDDNPKNSFLPCNFTNPNCITYTGTHDNDTSVGWYMSDRLNDADRERIKHFSNRVFGDHQGIHQDLIYLALSSICKLAIFPLQDVLGFGNDCRMNTPGTCEGNWAWRCSEEFITEELATWLKEKTELFGRGRQQHVHIPPTP